MATPSVPKLSDPIGQDVENRQTHNINSNDLAVGKVPLLHLIELYSLIHQVYMVQPPTFHEFLIPYCCLFDMDVYRKYSM
jgi:hypothetical protein